MQSFSQRFDRLAGIETENNFARWLERISFFFLILMILCAPHSIAATQTSWLAGMFVWLIRLALVAPRPRLVRTPLDIALWALFGWSVLSSVLSYAPDISLDKLRNAALFLIFYFIVNLVRSRSAACFLAGALVFSTMFVVLWTPLERVAGRGVEISGMSPKSPLFKGHLNEGDTVLEADGRKIGAPEELVAALETKDAVRVKIYRPDYYIDFEIKRADLLPGAGALERLGVADWKRNRTWRSAGFFSHYTMFAEILQLVASLALGIFIALVSRRASTAAAAKRDLSGASSGARAGDGGSNSGGSGGRATAFDRLKARFLQPEILLLAFCLAAMMLALLLTVTRAAQLSFLFSALVMGFLSGSRKTILWLAAVILPLALAGLFLLQYTRNVGFFDLRDNSILWRLTVYGEGWDLATANARHLLVGVGMDSIRRYAKDWHLFDNGQLPVGHFHSTPLQLMVERGLPALFFWLWSMWLYGRSLLRYLKSQSGGGGGGRQSAVEKGVVLGAFGGLIGFLTSSLVHYNYGAAVVAMMFFIVMGLSMRIVTAGEKP